VDGPLLLASHLSRELLLAVEVEVHRVTVQVVEPAR
jgi:hypothetical protein